MEQEPASVPFKCTVICVYWSVLIVHAVTEFWLRVNVSVGLFMYYHRNGQIDDDDDISVMLSVAARQMWAAVRYKLGFIYSICTKV